MTKHDLLLGSLILAILKPDINSNFENAFKQMSRANILVIVQLVIHAERLSRIYCCCKAIFEFYLKGWDELGRPSSLSVSFFPKVSFFVKNQFDGKHNNQVSYFSRWVLSWMHLLLLLSKQTLSAKRQVRSWVSTLAFFRMLKST